MLSDRMHALGLDSRHMSNLKVAAIGDATEKALNDQLNIIADLVPTRYVAESLAGELIAKHDISGKKILLLRADIARPALPKLLEKAGAQVDEIAAYETKIAEQLPKEVISAFTTGTVDWITFTSSSTVTNFCKLIKNVAPINNTKIASIGPITTQTIKDCNLQINVEAETSNIQGLIDAILKANS